MKDETKKPDLVVFNEETQTYDAALKPYGTSASSPVIKPTNTATWTGDGVRRVNKILKGKFEEVKKEYELLMEKFHYNDMLYNAKFGFEPIIGETYHLYKNKKEELFLSIIEPTQWDLEHKGSFRLNSDKMWEKIEAISKQKD